MNLTNILQLQERIGIFMECRDFPYTLDDYEYAHMEGFDHGNTHYSYNSRKSDFEVVCKLNANAIRNVYFQMRRHGYTRIRPDGINDLADFIQKIATVGTEAPGLFKSCKVDDRDGRCRIWVVLMPSRMLTVKWLYTEDGLCIKMIRIPYTFPWMANRFIPRALVPATFIRGSKKKSRRAKAIQKSNHAWGFFALTDIEKEQQMMIAFGMMCVARLASTSSCLTLDAVDSVLMCYNQTIQRDVVVRHDVDGLHKLDEMMRIKCTNVLDFQPVDASCI